MGDDYLCCDKVGRGDIPRDNAENDRVVGKMMNHLIKPERPPEVCVAALRFATCRGEFTRGERFPSPEVFFSGLDAIHREMDGKVKQRKYQGERQWPCKRQNNHERKSRMNASMGAKRQNKRPVIGELPKHVFSLEGKVGQEVFELVDDQKNKDLFEHEQLLSLWNG